MNSIIPNLFSHYACFLVLFLLTATAHADFNIGASQPDTPQQGWTTLRWENPRQKEVDSSTLDKRLATFPYVPAAGWWSDVSLNHMVIEFIPVSENDEDDSAWTTKFPTANGLHYFRIQKGEDRYWRWKAEKQPSGEYVWGIIEIEAKKARIFFSHSMDPLEFNLDVSDNDPHTQIALVAKMDDPTEFIQQVITVNPNITGSGLYRLAPYELQDADGKPKPTFSFDKNNLTDTIIMKISKRDNSLSATSLYNVDLVLTKSEEARSRADIWVQRRTVKLNILDVSNPLVNCLAFEDPTPTIVSANVSAMDISIVGDRVDTAYISVRGARVGRQIELADFSGSPLVYNSRRKGYEVFLSSDPTHFSVRIIDPQLVRSGSKKKITFTIRSGAKASNPNVKVAPLAKAKRKILTFVNTSPLAYSDEFGFDPDTKQIFLMNLTSNDVPYYNTLEETSDKIYIRGLRRNENDPAFTSEIITHIGAKVSIKNDSEIEYDVRDVSIPLMTGYTDVFEYQLGQLDGGVAVARVTITMGSSLVARAKITYRPTISSDKRPSYKATYYDPFSKKAFFAKKMKKAAVRSTWDPQNMSDSQYLSIAKKIPGYNKRLLSKSMKGYKANSKYNIQGKEGVYFADLLKTTDSVGNTYYQYEQLARMNGIRYVNQISDLFQVASIGLTVTRKNVKENILTLNMVPANNVHVVDSIYQMDNKGDTRLAYFTLAGNYFGYKPSVYCQYKDSKGRIKKLSFSMKRSIKVDGVVKKRPSPEYPLNLMHGSEEWIAWNKSAEKLMTKYPNMRFDLILDNGSFLYTVPRFDLKALLNGTFR